MGADENRNEEFSAVSRKLAAKSKSKWSPEEWDQIVLEVEERRIDPEKVSDIRRDQHRALIKMTLATGQAAESAQGTLEVSLKVTGKASEQAALANVARRAGPRAAAAERTKGREQQRDKYRNLARSFWETDAYAGYSVKRMAVKLNRVDSSAEVATIIGYLARLKKEVTTSPKAKRG